MWRRMGMVIIIEQGEEYWMGCRLVNRSKMKSFVAVQIFLCCDIWSCLQALEPRSIPDGHVANRFRRAACAGLWLGFSANMRAVHDLSTLGWHHTLAFSGVSLTIEDIRAHLGKYIPFQGTRVCEFRGRQDFMETPGTSVG